MTDFPVVLQNLLNTRLLSTALLQTVLRKGSQDIHCHYHEGILTVYLTDYHKTNITHYLGENVSIIYNTQYEVVGFQIEGIKP